MTELENYINNYFGVVNTSELGKIATLFKEEEFKKGEYFLQSHKTCKKLSFIQSGLMRIYIETEKKEITQWISTEGYFVTDLSSFIFGTQARWTIQALTNTKVLTIHKSDYDRISEIVPKWFELERLFLVKCFTTLEERIFSHLSMTAEERYNYFFENNKELFNQVPLQYIASMLGMSPETISRIRSNNSV